MRLVGSGEQAGQHYLYRADGTIAAGGTPQLVLGRSQSRSHLVVQNLSTAVMYLEIGTGAATATLTSGVVTSVAVTNAGFGFSKPPLVRFHGGGFPATANNSYSNYVGLAQPGGPPPLSVPSSNNSTQPVGKVATAHCVMTGSAPNMTIASITVDDGGAGYILAPYVQIINSDLDPNGAAAPASGVGIYLGPSGGNTWYNGTVCPTDPVAIWCATTSAAFTCRWMS